MNALEYKRWDKFNNVINNAKVACKNSNNEVSDHFSQTGKMIDIAGRIDEELKGNDAKEIIKVINNYKDALNLLDDYDHRVVSKPKGTTSSNIIKYEDCMNIINKLKFNNDSNLFALERNKGLQSIIGNIYASFDGKDVYPTIEEKAANFLYLYNKKSYLY